MAALWAIYTMNEQVEAVQPQECDLVNTFAVEIMKREPHLQDGQKFFRSALTSTLGSLNRGRGASTLLSRNVAGPRSRATS